MNRRRRIIAPPFKQRGFIALPAGIGFAKPGEVPGTAGATPEPLASNANYATTTILLTGEGSNGSTTIVDKIGNAWTASGNAQITTTNPKYGSGAILLDGSGDYISAEITNAVGTGDFTIEADIRVDSLAADGEIFCISTSDFDLNNFNIVFEYKTTGALRGSIQTGSSGTVNVDITTATGQLTTGTYYHVAFTANGSTAKLWIDGVEKQSGTITGTRANGRTNCRVGRLGASITRYFNGRVDNLRVTRGVALYTATFTPPTAAHYAWYSALKDTSYTTSGTNDAQGITTDGTSIWYSNSTTLFKYSKTGVLDTSRSVTGDNPTSKTQINGLAIRDGRLFVSAAENSSPRKSWVVEYNPATLAYVQHWQITGDWFSEGLAWYGGYWWVIFHAHKVVARCDAHFNVIDTFNLSFSITGSSGGYGGTQGYDGIAWFGRYLFVNVHTQYDQHKLDVYYWNGSGFTEICRMGQPSTKAHQGIAFDPSDSGVMWFAERNASGTDSFMKATFT